MQKIILFLFFCFFSAFASFATHIVGGELNYKYLGNNNYEIRLTVYRDCWNGEPPFDNPAAVGIFNSSNALITTLEMALLAIDTLPPTINNPCMIPPANICYEHTTYLDTVSLSPLSGGYQLVYERCCRNQSILNIIDPGATGGTYTAYIPDANSIPVNSNPVFKNWPPPFICVNTPFEFDHSATDYDGDSLVYSICDPIHGVNGALCYNSGGNCCSGLPQPCGPQPNPPFNPPYDIVVWKPPYSLANIFGGVPLTINSQTGLLAATPNTIGQFVYGVCVQEFRNGILVSQTSRDFQVNVVNCPNIIVASIQSPLINCGSFTAEFTNNSVGAGIYLWNFGDTTTLTDTSNLFEPDYTYPDTGTYSVMLIASSSVNPDCKDTSFGTVNIFLPVTFVAHDDTVLCLNASMKIGAPADTSLFYSWNPPLGLDNANVSNPNASPPSTIQYIVTATNSVTGCNAKDTVNITVISPPVFDAGSDKSICPNDSIFIGNAQQTNYSYQWNAANNLSDSAISQPLAFPDSSTVFFLLVTDTSNKICPNTITDSVLVSVFSLPQIDAGNDTLICFGDSILLSATSTSTATFLWNTRDTVSSITAADAAVYFVTVTDSNGCQQTDSVKINVEQVQSTFTANPTTSCLNCNGTAVVAPFGGLLPYSFLWNDSAATTTSTAINLCAGNYLVTVTDSIGCIHIQSIIINDTVNMFLTLVDSVNVLCNGNCTGEIFTSVSGGSAPYNFLWSNAGTTATIDSLCAGIYNLTMTDGGNCKRFLTVNISEPPPILLSENSTNVDCFGNNSGSATVAASGGVSPYSYLWSTGDTSSSVFGLPSSVYFVTITDNNNCIKDTSVQITEPELLVSATSGTPPTCFNVNDGTAEVVVSGGTSPYTYLWDTGVETQNVASLQTGNYSVTITDAMNCTKSDSVKVDSLSFYPQPIFLSADTTTIYEGESTVLHAIYDTSGNFYWMPPSSLNSATTANPIASPNVTTTYVFVVSAQNNSSCFYNDSITIFVIEKICGEPDIFIPNAFTPNNDNYNDILFVRGNYIKEMHFIIYDRWGEKIFETENQSNGWDGNFKAMKCDPGVFVYYLSVTCTDEQKFFKKGNITLLR